MTKQEFIRLKELAKQLSDGASELDVEKSDMLISDELLDKIDQALDMVCSGIDAVEEVINDLRDEVSD